MLNIGNQLTPFQGGNAGAQRDLDVDILTLAPGLVASLAGLTVLGDELARLAKIRQGIQIMRTNHVDRTAITAVTAIRAAHRDIFFTTKADDAVAALACTYVDFGLVDEFHGCYPPGISRLSKSSVV